MNTEGKKVVFQGAPGAYSQAAMVAYFGRNIDNFYVDTFRMAMEAIAEERADYAVLPIENSTAGIISENFDLLSEFENYIVGEQIIPIRHCLMVSPGTSLKDIKRVYSHPQSLMQSARFLKEHGEWQAISMANNAFAARKIQEEKNPEQAAIASQYAAELYGLEILIEGVNDNSHNSTRFIIVSKHQEYRPDAGKISMCFELPNRSGALYHILSHFIFHGMNMTRIESRPIEERNWQYRFFVDVEGNLQNSEVQKALEGLKRDAIRLRILGNY